MGRKTKFYLGYESNGVFKPLSILDNNLRLIGDSLTDLIEYTTLFDNEMQLRTAIKNGPTNCDIPYSSRIVYLAETNNPNYPYRIPLGLDHICYSLSKSLLDPNIQKQYFRDNKFDIDLFSQLYMASIFSKSSIGELSNFYTEEDKKNFSPRIVIERFKEHRNEIANGNNYIFTLMDGVYNEVIHATEVGEEKYEYDLDRLDLDYLINRLYDNLTIKKDKKNNFKHDPDTGMYLRDEKIVGYITIMISKNMEDKYKKYAEYMEEKAMNEPAVDIIQETNDVYRDVEGHDEEFLTKEDFERFKGDEESQEVAESQGYIVRKSGL